ncbi:MAG TPA: rod shape-determining protein MreC [Candidatus Babeliaceae bacterium]|nr:rod shape-determining protein MreC [Candidatus Babeliaceae bacterium]
MKTLFTKDSQPGLRMFILVVLSVTLMILDTRVTTVTHVRTALSIALVPLQYMVSGPIRFIDTLSKVISSHDALVKENLDLKSQQLLLRAQVQRLLAIENENNQLKALSRSSSGIHGKVLIAQLLAVDTDPFVHQVMLNKGSKDGVYIGQPVLDANGVMGKIIHVGPLTSRVLLVNDPHSGVPAQDARNGVRAIAMGDSYTGKLHLVNVPQTIDIKKGDIIVTSGLGKDFPEGYPLGIVTEVIKDLGLQFSIINVEPSAHLDRARQVLLVWPNRESPGVMTPVNPDPLPMQPDSKDFLPGATKSNV